jgi:mannosyltransferase OCH1-like enzyme
MKKIKTIHQIWLGKINKKVIDLVENTKRINSNYNHILWTNANIKEFEEFYELFYKNDKINKNLALLTDVLRIYIIQKYGGFYFDVDMIFLKSLDNYDYEFDFMISKDKFKYLQNCVLYSLPKTNILQKLINLYKVYLRINRIPRVFELFYDEIFISDNINVRIENDYRYFCDNSDESIITKHLTWQTWSKI